MSLYTKPILVVSLYIGLMALTSQGRCGQMTTQVDPITRYVHVTYAVPANAPDEVVVRCFWSPAGRDRWKPARVMPLLSETALRLTPSTEWQRWMRGELTERRSAGLERTLVFNPYPDAQQQGRVDVRFRIRIETPDGQVLATDECKVRADNTDVIYIEDWSRVIRRDAVAAEEEKAEGKWLWRTGVEPPAGATFGNCLFGKASGHPLPQLTFPLNLRGWYAVFVCTEPRFGIRLRLTGDERSDTLASSRPFEEVLWRWCRMDRQHLVLKQCHTYTGFTDSQVDYVKLVPLPDEKLRELEAEYGGEHDKMVAGYFEPYSWAFVEYISDTLQHRQPLTAYAEAGIDLVDIQVGRFGMKAVYESRVADQLLYSTMGDPLDGGIVPTTDNVGSMQQFTCTLDAELRYAREMGLSAHANFGATNCYPGTPLESDFSRKHPEWRRGSALRYEVPEVQEYILSLCREVLEIGATGLSLDFCRYPEGIDQPETCNQFLRRLRHLLDELGQARGRRIPLLIRFPAQGVRLWQNFDYRTWVREGLVDILCPSNIQGRHHHFDIQPYVEAVRGTPCKLLPVVDGLSWGPAMPGPFLWRVRQIYEAGADGVYVYQADARLLGLPSDRRCMRLLGSRSAVLRWWERDAQWRPRRSKGIYIAPPDYPSEGYHSWERLRVWLEGVPMGEVEMVLDGQLVNRLDAPPYVLGGEGYEFDRVIPPGEHVLRVRARDGDGWLEQQFTIRGAP